MKKFYYNDTEFTEQEVASAANEKGLSVDEYTKEFGIQSEEDDDLDLDFGDEPSGFWDTIGKLSDNKVYRGINPIAQAGVDALDYMGDLYDTFTSGMQQASASGETTDLMFGDTSDATINAYRKADKEAMAAPPVESQQKWAESTEKYKKDGDNGFLAGLKATIDNPQMAIDVGVSSMGMMAQTIGENPATVAAGAGAGAAAGSVIPGVGTVSGGLAGFRLAASTAMEGTLTFGELLKEELEERGGSFESNEDIRSLLEDEEAVGSMRRRAIGRGLAIGAVDAIFGKLSGSVGKTINKASRVSKVAGAAKAAGLEMIGGGVGETAGMTVAGQELAGEEIFAEMVGSAPGSAFSIAAANVDAKAGYYLNGQKLKSKEDIIDLVNNGTDEDLINARIKVTDDQELSNQIDKRYNKIIKTNQEAAKKKVQPQAVTDALKDLDTEIKKKDTEYKKVKESDGVIAAEIVKKQADELKAKKSKIEDVISYQLDDLSEEEMGVLVDLDNDVSLYQSILNDPSSSEAAKKAAKEEITKAKVLQEETFTNPDAQDLRQPEGPKKQKNVELSRKTQEAYEKGDIDGVVKSQGGTIGSIATSLWSRVPADKQIGTYDDFKAAIVTAPGGLLDMIKTYNPEDNKGVPLASYIGDRRKGLRVRANRIIKGLTKQDTDLSTDSSEALNSFASNEININKISLGPKYNSQKLGLGTNLLDEAANDVELGTVAVEKALTEADSKGKTLSQKQKQTVSEKAFNNLFKNKYVKKVKDKIGKKLNQKEYIKNNTSVLKAIAISNINFQKGTGVTKDWNQFPPSDQVFQDYYEGTDTDNAQAISDRKKKLAEAITTQIAVDAKDNYFEGKEAERVQIGENLGIAFQEAVDEINDAPGANIFMKDQDMIRNSDEVNAANKSWKAFSKQNNVSDLNRSDANFLNDFKNKFTSKYADRFPKNFWTLGNFAFSSRSIFGNKEGLNNQLEGVEFKEDPYKLPERFTYTTNKKLKSFGSRLNKKDIRAYIKTDDFKNSEAEKLPALKNIFLTIQDILKTDPEALPYIVEMLKDATNSQNHFMRYLAPFKFFTKNFDATVVEEHSLPQVIVSKFLLQSAIDGKVEENFKYIEKNYFQGALEKIHDDMLKGEIDGKKFNLQQKLLEGQMWTDSTWARYFNKLVQSNGGIDPSVYELLNGKSIAEEFNVTSSGILANVELENALSNKVEDKIQSAIQFQEDSITDPELNNDEKVEALTDLLNSVYGTKATSNKQTAIDYLKNLGYSDEVAKNAVEQKGFRVPGLIYVNSQKASVDTPMHEFTHEWAEIVNNKDPELFNAIYDKLKNHPLFEAAVKRMADSKFYSQYDPNSFEYKNEIMAHILGEEGKSLYELFEGDAEAKTLIDKFFDYIKEALGFDPATKNFADLTIDEVIKLAVKDISEGNPAANFDKLKNVAEGKSWYAKTEATQSPSAKAKSDPILRALNKLKLEYRKNKDLASAILESYKDVQGLMSLEEYTNLINKNSKEVNTGKTKQLLIGKAEYIKAQLIAEASAKKLAEGKLSEEKANSLQDKFRRLIYIAKGEGAKASKWFIPPNAEDFKGLLYTFLPKGKAGIEARKWMEETLLKPYSDAIAALDTEILNKSKAWKQMSKGFDFNKKVDGTPYTLGDAIKVYNALKEGVDPGIAKKKHLDALIHAVESDSDVLNLAEEIASSFPIELKSGWQNRSFAKEIYDSINDGSRKRHLETFSANVDAIFNDTTLDLIADQFGVKYRQALVNTLKRLKSGRNRTANDANANAYMNWLNRAVGTTMFLNVRSAALQLLSTLNFINKPGNNLFQATRAFANREQWNKDYQTLWNSDYLTSRRDGAKFDVLADEIANDPDNWISKILQKGFLPTRYADSFAIALGGASYYRNRVNALVKEGMSVKNAEKQALADWREVAEESQQSSDPSKISEIQASSVGKIIYAFANTPFQYARITKRKLQDLTSGRSAAEGNVKKDLQTIFYYSTAQALVFNALQSGLVALLMGDSDDEELKDEKYISMIERSLTSFLKSTGNPGAVASTLYAMLKEAHLQQAGEKRVDPNALAITATSISPPINSKLRDIAGAYRAYNKIEEADLLTPSLDNEALTMAGEVAAIGGIPLDRVIRKARHISAISNENAELWQKIWMLMGWSAWDLGYDPDAPKKTNVDLDLGEDLDLDLADDLDLDFSGALDLDFDEDLDLDFGEDTPVKKLERGVAGVANRDGTIEVDPNLSPVEREKTIAHEEQHVKDIEAGKLDYDDDYVYWNNNKYERKDGNIIYNGKAYVEGHKDLPWEKKAYAAEPSTSEAKKAIKRLY